MQLPCSRCRPDLRGPLRRSARRSRRPCPLQIPGAGPGRPRRPGDGASADQRARACTPRQRQGEAAARVGGSRLRPPGLAGPAEDGSSSTNRCSCCSIPSQTSGEPKPCPADQLAPTQAHVPIRTGRARVVRPAAELSSTPLIIVEAVCRPGRPRNLARRRSARPVAAQATARCGSTRPLAVVQRTWRSLVDGPSAVVVEAVQRSLRHTCPCRRRTSTPCTLAPVRGLAGEVMVTRRRCSGRRAVVALSHYLVDDAIAVIVSAVETSG